MKQPLTKSQQNTRLLLYFILAVIILSNFLATFFELNINKTMMLFVQTIVSLGVLVFASIRSIIDWKSFWVYLLIALSLTSIAYLR
ncbi:MAG: hypothetical protein KA534_03475 [Sediminibacterium sp.]|jgi:hypothetical protein|nr:hypothetical protein [Sediminibacterium sp.]